MSEYGMQVWDANGKEIFNSKHGCARFIGSFVPSAASGSFNVPQTSDGQPLVNLFAYTRFTSISFQISVPSANVVLYSAVWVIGNTIHWTGLGANNEGSRIFYGDSYL